MIFEILCLTSKYRLIINRDTIETTGIVEQRNLDTAATEFQRRFHISADDEGRHRNSVVNQVSNI